MHVFQPKVATLAALLILGASPAFPQANGRFQLHFMNVGQGDGAVLISPAGEIVLFDSGVRNNCDLPLAYLQQLGVDSVHYHVASHYHDDHIGCADTVLAAFPLRRAAIDRGGTYTTGTYTRYVQRAGALRRAATPGMTITLDSGTANPVVITIRVVNGVLTTGDTAATNNENDRSVLAWVRFGLFDALIGGDLSGERTSSYRDVETPAASGLSQVELYKVHHHGSQHSSNATWLTATAPMVGIISSGMGNVHGHPTVGAMARLHAANVRTYWTTAGNGAAPVAGRDVVGGNIIVEVAPGSPDNAILREFFARDEFTSGAALQWHAIGLVLAAVVPFAYGGLGAAAFLLRAAHGHLHSRTFDPNHIPEYYSRMLLGVIAGGAIQLLITQVADETGVIKLSAAAVAFVAGYNSDLLFSTVERISAALLPKVGLTSMRVPESAAVTGLSVPALLEQLDKAQSDEARDVIRGLLGKVRERV